MKGIVFRSARPEEADVLTRLAVASKRHWGYPDAWIELWRNDLEFTPESIRSDSVIVAEEGSQVVGVVAVSCSHSTAELEGLWVHPSRIGRCLGRALFERALDAARARGATALSIVSDPNAVGFYLRMGGRPAGIVASKPVDRVLPKLLLSIAPTTGCVSCRDR